MDTKLTVRVERELIETAKRYAKKKGVTLSALIENYLRNLAIMEDEAIIQTPVLEQMTGILPSHASIDDFNQHIEEKYG